MSGNILFLGNKIFEIPPFFQTRSGDLGKQVHACSLRFYALNLRNDPFPSLSLSKVPSRFPVPLGQFTSVTYARNAEPKIE